MSAKSSNKLVLVVDDEEMVAQATCDMLDYLGYQSSAVSTGNEAIVYFREHTDEIFLVILDCKLPDLSGNQVYVELKAIRADIPVLMATGLERGETRMNECLQACDCYLQKPYGLKKLGEALKNLITSQH